MKQRYLVRTIILAGSFLLQLGTFCFQSRGAANDDFADAEILSGPTGTTSGNNSDATKEPNEPDHAGNEGGNSVWFRWTAPANGQFSFDTTGSDFDTVLAVYTGASLDALNEEASNDDGDFDLTSAVSFLATSGTLYFVAVDGFDGEAGALVLNWAIELAPVNDNIADATEITGSSGDVTGSNLGSTKEPDEPDHAGNAGGSSIWFRWTAPADGQFSFNTSGSAIDTVLAVYTGASLDALNEEASNDDGVDLTSAVSFLATSGTLYLVAVDGFDGEAGDLVLNWALELPPVNDNFADATELTGSSGDVTGNSAGATKEPGEPDHAGNLGGSSVWFRWIAPASGRFLFDTAGSDFDTVLAVYTGVSLDALNEEASNDDGDFDVTSALSFQASSGTAYYVAVDGYDDEDGAFVLNWATEPPPINDDFADATEITGLSGNAYGRNSSATQEPGEPDHAGNAGGSSVWFRWIAPASGQCSFDTTGSAFDTLLAVYTGASVNALTPVASNDDGDFDATSVVSFQVLSGTPYYVAVDGYDGEVGALVLNWSPAITDATGVTFTTLHSFTNGSDGSEPFAGVIVSGNTLYGATLYGGSSGNGTVFKINADGTGYTTLHSFNYTAGANPYAVLVLAGNTLYGTTRLGGSSGQGTVFAVNTNGTGFTNLHSFAPISDGALPLAGLILSGDTLYGTASSGGSSGNGTVFAVKTNGIGFTNLHNFTALINSTNGDGAVPFGSLVMAGNTLYGTTISGGSSGVGTMFAVSANGTDFTNLHDFNWSGDGGYPHTAILSGNRLYGTTGGGGNSGNGTVFAVNTDGTGFTTLHSFADVIGSLYTNRTGANPFAGLLLSGGTLYGTALGGGSSGRGTVFSLNTNGMDFTILHSFTAFSGPSSTNRDGALPYGGLALSRHTLYGAAGSGGSFGSGTVFSLSLPPPRLTIVPSGANVILTWPINAAGFGLQSTTNLISPAVWTTDSPGPVVVTGQNTVTNPVSGPQRFFRLKSQ